MKIEERLRELGLVLPPLPVPPGNFIHFVRSGDLLFLAGKGPYAADGTLSTGKVGGDVTEEAAYRDARQIGLLQIATMKLALGDLERVNRIVKVLGMVNAVPEFAGHPQVINGFSDLMVEVFGEKGRHARSAVGMGSLPNQQTVEIEVIVEVAR